MKTKLVLAETGEVALALLRVTAASSDWFPPMKGAAGGALHIAELVKVCILANSTLTCVSSFYSRDFNHTRKTGLNLANTFKVQLHASFESCLMPVNLEMT